MEKYVVSLEMAKRLKELGVKTNTQFCYVPDNMYHKNQTNLKFHPRDDVRMKDKCYPAPMTDELLEVLPKKIDGRDLIESYTNKFITYAINHETDGISAPLGIVYYGEFMSRKRVDALAELLIWCIEKGYVKVDE